MSINVSILDYITDPNEGGINLKIILDHITNYIISGSVMSAGAYVFRHGSMLIDFNVAGKFIGTIIFFIGFFLYAANFVLAVRFMSMKDFSQIKWLSFSVYVSLALPMFMVVADFTFSILFQALGVS
jgi:hypothetical protein